MSNRQSICKHRGEQIGSIADPCPKCKGKPIYACALHGRCASTQQQAETVAVRACVTCPDSTVEIACPWLKRGCCEAAGRLARIPQTRCKVGTLICRRCLAESATPGPGSPTDVIREVARRGALEYDPAMARRV